METGRRHLASVRISRRDGFAFLVLLLDLTKAKKEAIVACLIQLALGVMLVLCEIAIVRLVLEFEGDEITKVVRHFPEMRERTQEGTWYLLEEGREELVRVRGTIIHQRL